MSLPADAVPPPPRTPSPRARKLVFRFSAAQRVLLIVGGLFVVIGTALAVPLCYWLPADLAILATRQTARGIIVHAKVDKSVRFNRRHPTRVGFSYVVNGVPYFGLSTMLDPPAADTQPTIEYASFKPEWARLAGSTRSPFGYATAWTALHPFIGLCLVAFTIRARRRRAQAFIEGTPIVARRVFSGFDMKTRINGKNPYQVQWQFSVDEKPYSASLSSMDPSELQDLAQADEAIVLYRPDNPKVNTIYVE